MAREERRSSALLGISCLSPIEDCAYIRSAAWIEKPERLMPRISVARKEAGSGRVDVHDVSEVIRRSGADTEPGWPREVLNGDISRPDVIETGERIDYLLHPFAIDRHVMDAGSDHRIMPHLEYFVADINRTAEGYFDLRVGQSIATHVMTAGGMHGFGAGKIGTPELGSATCRVRVSI